MPIPMLGTVPSFPFHTAIRITIIRQLPRASILVSMRWQQDTFQKFCSYQEIGVQWYARITAAIESRPLRQVFQA